MSSRGKIRGSGAGDSDVRLPWSTSAVTYESPEEGEWVQPVRVTERTPFTHPSYFLRRSVDAEELRRAGIELASRLKAIRDLADSYGADFAGTDAGKALAVIAARAESESW